MKDSEWRRGIIIAMADKTIPPGLLEQGTVACLFKPFSEQDLQAALAAALQLN